MPCEISAIRKLAASSRYLSFIARGKADLVAARSYCEQSLSEFRRLHDKWGIASVLSDLASLSCDQGNNAEARRLYGESIKLFQELVTNAALQERSNVSP